MIKIEMPPDIKPVRGAPVKEGGIYTNRHTMYFRLVLAVVPTTRDRPYNNVVCLHINVLGEIVGSSNQPEVYMSNHMDLVGVCEAIPTLEIKWLKSDAKSYMRPAGRDIEIGKKARK